MDDLRKRINVIDLEILQKLRERMFIVEKIGIFKNENNIEVLDSSREESLLNFLKNCNIKVFKEKKNEEFITDLWNVIMKYSKEMQKVYD
jgi:chorismate mutase